MSDDDARFSSAIAPRPVVLTTTAVVAVGIAALGVASRSWGSLFGAASGALLALALSRMSGDLSLRSYAAGIATLLASVFAGTVALAAALGPYASGASLALVGALWLAAVAGVGVGRDALSSQPLSRGFVASFAALVGIGVAFPLAGVTAAVVSLGSWLFGVFGDRPAVGTLLALCAGACFVVGLVLRSTTGDALARRPINRQLRARAADATTAGVWLLVAGAAAGFLGGLAGGYGLLAAVASPVWRLLTVVTGSPVVRAVPIGVAALAGLAWTARKTVAWAWTEDGLDVARAGALISGAAGVALLLVVVAVGLVFSAPPRIGVAAGRDPSAVGPVEAAGHTVAALLVTSVALFVLRSLAGSDRRAPPSLWLCIAGLLAGAVVVAVTSSSVVAPLVAVAAASIVWDVGRVGATMGFELGDEAAVRRGALVRIGGSVVVAALGALAAAVLATGATRIGPVLDGPVVSTLGGAVALVVALAWYARNRDAAPSEN